MALSVTRVATPTIENGYVGSGDTVTIPSFVVDGTDKALFVCIALWQDVAGTGTVSGITYNSVALTKIAEKTVTGGAMRAEIWRLVNPGNATANIVATITGDTDARKMGAILFAGADQTDPDEATQTSEGSSSPITLNITTLTDGAIVIDAAANFSTAAITIGAGQTQIMDDQTGSTGGVASYEAKATAGSVTMSWTKTGTDDWAQCAVSVKPKAGSALTKSLTDTMSLADTPIKTAKKNLTDSMTVAEVVGKKPVLIKTDAVVIAETLLKTFRGNKTDSVIIADSLGKASGKNASDAVILADSISKTIAKPLTDNMTFADALSATILVILLRTDAINLSDSLTKVITRTLLDSITFIDNLTQIYGLTKTDSLIISDAVLKALVKPITENISIADAITRITDKNITDTVSLSEAIIKTYSLNKTDSVALADAVAKVALVNKVDALILADSLAKLIAIGLVDSEVISDSLATVSPLHVNLTDSMTISDIINSITVAVARTRKASMYTNKNDLFNKKLK